MQKADKNTNQEIKTVCEGEPPWIKRVLDAYERIKREGKRRNEIGEV